MKSEEVKTYYNSRLRGQPSAYEDERWFKDAQRRAGYHMQKMFLLRFLKKYKPDFRQYLEAGPGPGTWTRIFYAYRPKAHFEVVEISEEMSKQFNERFGDKNNVEIHTTDFLIYKGNHFYDFFFSSRALEYISDKKAAVQKMHHVLTDNGRGLIITKNPHYKRERLRERKTAPFHSGQIAPRDLVCLLQEARFRDIEVSPVSFVFPVLHFSWLNMALFYILSPLPWNAVSSFFAESYAVTFRKIW